MADPLVTTGGRNYVSNAVKLLSPIFEDDPAIVYMLSSLSDKARLAYMDSYFHSLITAAALNDAVFEEANNWSCVTIWMKPGRKVDNPWTYIQAGGLTILWRIGLQGCKVSFPYMALCLFKALMYSETTREAYACRVPEAEQRGEEERPRTPETLLLSVLRRNSAGSTKERFASDSNSPFDYFGIDGKPPSGLSSALIRRYQAIARREGIPVWLEATTSNSMRLYKSLGFEVIQVIVLGKGTSGADGKPQRGGEGVKIWAMIWEPDAPTKGDVL